MKLTKKTINLLIFLFAIIVSYFLNQQEKSTPTQTITASSAVSQAQQAVKNNYDIAMADDKYGQNATAPVDYYMLALSWSPAFCEAQREKNHGKIPEKAAYQCASDRQFGWVIHGLWAQSKNAKAQLNVEGICNSCKARIEKAALGVKGVKYAQWNVDSHQLSLVLDERKTSTAQVQEAIAKVGHSNSLVDGTHKVEASEEDYNKVSDCCKYRDEEVVKNHH